MFRQILRILVDFATLSLECVKDNGQHFRKAGPAIPVLAWEICSAKEWLPTGKEKNRERPATAAGHRLNGAHVDLIEIRSLFAIDFNVDEVFIHGAGNFLVFERFAFHDMTP